MPIKKLHDVTTTIARHDIEALVTTDNADEITELGMSFNIMVGKIKELLDAKIEEHEKLKKAELRALQAQINPHFLYNTLDAIIWMAEAKRIDQVVELVRVLSRFFRITLSKGKDWITMREEIEHVESYLAIQKMRYRDILDYQIDVPDDMRDGQMLKLTLQPLVENALYHGIKNKRNGGAIVVRGRRLDGDLLQIQIEDNGIGMTQERLAQIRALLEADAGDAVIGESGYGVNNVNQRIKLYYGQAYGLTIESEYMHGACVSVVIPLQRAPAFARHWRSAPTKGSATARPRGALHCARPGPSRQRRRHAMNIRALCRCALCWQCFLRSPPAVARLAHPNRQLFRRREKENLPGSGRGVCPDRGRERVAHGQHPLIQETAQRLGVELKFSDAQQQQANQIKAIRSFIAQRVDVIGVSPVVETGWDTVFAEVKQAGIPLILLDRHADVPDDLFSAFIGSDFVQ